MERYREFDAIAIGAGVAGGSMAAVLAGKGWRTLLIDRHPFPRHKACGEFLSPESAGILRSLGLESRLESLSPARIDGLLLTAADGTALNIPLPAPALGISRYRLDAALQEAAKEQGAEILNGVSVMQIKPEGKGYAVDLRGKGERTTVATKSIIGCWGRSPPPGGPTERRLPGGSTLKALRIGVKQHVEGLESRSQVELYLFNGGYLGIAPIEGGRHNIAALVSGGFFEQCGRTTAGVLETACRQNRALASRLDGHSCVPGTEAAAYPVVISAKTTAWGRVPHVGDAARVIPPLCGDGMAMALRSVQICAALADRYLRNELSLVEWRTAYLRAMRGHGAGPAVWGRLLAAVLCQPSLSRLALRMGAKAPRTAARLFRATRLEG